MATKEEKTETVEHSNKNQSASQEFLDNKQYAKKSVEKYERIFGTDFVSTGGATTTSHFCNIIFSGLKDKYGGNNAGPYKVLDIGCGIGGSAFHMVKNYNVCSVLGIDLSTNMINIANDKTKSYATELDESKAEENWAKKVTFKIGDALKQDYGENSFDLIYSRDTILHIFEKDVLFKLFYKWLKPNGMLFISDYCCAEASTHSEAFTAYIAKRGYHLHTPMEYGKIIGDCGFERVTTEDRTKHMISILKSEVESFGKIKDEFVKEFSQEDYDDILKGWNDKIERCSKGEQRWASFIAYKTLAFD